jgi:hypothetical protein
MASTPYRTRKILGSLALALLLVGAAFAWTERTPLLSWFYVRGLARADEATAPTWVERVASLGESAVPNLLATLSDPNPATCANARQAFVRLSSDWNNDARCVTLAGRFAYKWDAFSTPGKVSALEVSASWFRGGKETTSDLIATCARLLTASSHGEIVEVQVSALDLCGSLLTKNGAAAAVSPGRSVVRACLSNPDAGTRVLAIRLALHPGMDLLEDVAPLLNDPEAIVRRAAVMAVGPADQVVRDEGLLPSLHDADPEVRRLSELALRGRGLRPEHIKLGRVLTDPSPVVRLQVLDYLRRTPDLDAGIWLRRLSHDPSPAVRAAAMRAMCLQSSVDLTDRIDQMARNDPSPTVCVLARYYLKTSHPAHAEP